MQARAARAAAAPRRGRRSRTCRARRSGPGGRTRRTSIWLPEAGSLQTVVLFTPGKCAARMICLGQRQAPFRVAVDGARQAEPRRAACPPRAVPEDAARPQRPAPARRVIASRSCGRPPGRSRKPSSPARVPGQRAGRPASGVPAKTARRRHGAPSSSSRRALAPRPSRRVSRKTTRSAKTLAGRSGGPRPRSKRPADVARRDEHQVGARGRRTRRHRRGVRERGDHRLALRRPGHDRRALDA